MDHRQAQEENTHWLCLTGWFEGRALIGYALLSFTMLSQLNIEVQVQAMPSRCFAVVLLFK